MGMPKETSILVVKCIIVLRVSLLVECICIYCQSATDNFYGLFAPYK